MRETWYVLDDGTAVHPSEVSINKDGALSHKNGLVQMRDADTPRSRGVDIDEKTGKQLFAGKGDQDGDDHVGGSKKSAASAKEPAPAKVTTEMKPAPKPEAKPKAGYQTRETK